jgi:sugar O-acyltransferase (sialic acid O-acetyltransferase NeuD family)
MARVVVAGASGHGKKVAEALAALGHTVLGYLDTFKPAGTQVGRHQVLGAEEHLAQLVATHGIEAAVVGIGDNSVRVAMAGRIAAAVPGMPFLDVVHPAAHLAPGTVLGGGVVLMPGALVSVDCELGAHSLVDTGASLDHDSVLQEGASLAPGAVVGGGAHIGSCTAIGIGATVIHGRTIGAHTVVGAGAVVLRDLPANVVAYGVPAAVARQRTAGERYL